MVTENHCAQKAGKTENRNFADASRTDEAGVNPHKQRDRHGCRNGKRTPRTVGQRFHHNQGQHGSDDDHNHQDADGGDDARSRTQLLFDDVAQRFAVAAHRNKQHHHVLNRTGQNHAENNPQRTRQITHLRRQHGADQRTRTGNGRKMVAEQNFFIGRNIIHAVVVAFRRRHAPRIEFQNVFTDIEAVKTVGDAIHRDRSDDQPYRTDVLAAAQGQGGEGDYAHQHHQAPYQKRFQRFHDKSS